MSLSPATKDAIGAMLDSVAPGAGLAARVAMDTYSDNTRSKKGGQAGFLRGKLKGKKGTKKVKRKLMKRTRKGKRLTPAGYSEHGIVSGLERRHVMIEPDPGNVNTRYESVIVGHPSFPTLQTAQNLCRALFKYICKRLNISVRDYNWSVLAEGFVVGDQVRINYYKTMFDTSIASRTATVVIDHTFETFSVALYNEFIAILGETDATQIRWDSVEFLPNSASRFTGLNFELSNFEVNILTKSSLKIQNRTTNIVNDADAESDDVDRVPLSGYRYICKGNNALHAINRKILDGFGNASQQVYMVEPQARGVNLGVNLPYNSTSVFSKNSEPNLAHNYLNCKRVGKITLNPGDVKTSILKDEKKMTFPSLMRMLTYGVDSSKGPFGSDASRVYNPKAGQFAFMHLEKVIGNLQSSVKLNIEVDFIQSVACFGKRSNYTAPQFYQTDDL